MQPRPLTHMTERLFPPAERVEEQLFICATCLMDHFPYRGEALEFMRGAFVRMLGGEPYGEILTAEMPDIVSIHQSGGEGHLVVGIPYTLWMGPRIASEIAAELEALEPELSGPVTHWDERRPLSPAIAEELIQQRLDDLLLTKSDRRWFGLYLGPREDTRRGEDAEESLASLYFRVAIKRRQFRNRQWQTSVHFEAGLPNLLAIIAAQTPRLIALIDSRSERDNQVFLELVAWHLADMLLAATGRHGVMALLDDLWDEHVPPLAEALHQTQLSAHERALLLGDVMVLHRFVVGENLIPSSTLPRYKTLPQLFDALQAIDYPRLADAPGADRRQQYERLLVLMSRDMERANIARINWKPLMEAMRFKRSHKK